MKCKLAGIVALLAVSVLAVNARVDRRWIEACSLDCENMPLAHDVSAGYELLTVEVCAAMKGLRDTRRTDAPVWGVVLTLADSTARCITLEWGNTDPGDFTDVRYLTVSGLDTEPCRRESNVNVYGGDNTLIIEVASDRVARAYVGSDVMNYAGQVALATGVVGVEIFTTGKLDVGVGCLEAEYGPELNTGYDHDAIEAAAVPGPDAPLAGIWQYLDRDNDPDYARPGGQYTLALVPDPDVQGGYLMLYVAGAVVERDRWHEGMLKGRLTPLPFVGRYSLEWYDARGHRVDDEANASVGDDGVLTLNFPLLHAQLRYCRR